MRKQSEEAGAGGKVRLQRVLAAAGIAARRAAEEMIEEGRVEVNGRVVTQLPVFVDPEEDRIIVDGRPLPKAQRPIYIMVNKPERMLTVSADEPGMDRATVLDLIDHPARPRLVPIGRLDWNTPGLVLLTNDGNAVNRLTHPRYGVSKLYRAVVRGGIDDAAARDLEQRIGKLIRKDDKLAGRVRPGAGRVRIDVETADADRSTILIRVQGRTGNLASMFAGAGVAVRKLERIAIGPVELRGLARGRWRELEREEIHALRAAVKGKRTEAVKPAPPKRKRQGPPRAGAPVRQDRRRPEGDRRGRPPANRPPNPRNRSGPKPRKRA
jgi:23S rRNA pseudouridine2605 synthase